MLHSSQCLPNDELSPMFQYDIAPYHRPIVRLPNGLELRASVEPDGPLLDSFFAEYDRAFVLPNEKEEIDGFRSCLTLNLPPAYAPLAERHGPFREFVAVAFDTTGGNDTLVGGASLICYPLQSETGGTILAMNLNYIFVLPEHRRRGYLSRIVDACRQLARRAFRPRGGAPTFDSVPVLIFMELNDPLSLDQAAYALDTFHSGLDQLQRIGIWASAGARIIDFPYVQPALSATQAADRNLLLAVLGAPGTELSGCLIRDHMATFFAISVLKGADPAQDQDVQAQLRLLNDICRSGKALDLMDPRPYLGSQVGQLTATSLREPPRNLRDALRHYPLPVR